MSGEKCHSCGEVTRDSFKSGRYEISVCVPCYEEFCMGAFGSRTDFSLGGFLIIMLRNTVLRKK